MPVAVTATCCGYDTRSTGRWKSAMLANEMPHLKVGAQKWMVLGPAGWFQSACARDAKLIETCAPHPKVHRSIFP
eukprot:scaffold80_cov325-Pavlova_lutheri.AAC.54